MAAASLVTLVEEFLSPVRQRSLTVERAVIERSPRINGHLKRKYWSSFSKYHDIDPPRPTPQELQEGEQTVKGKTCVAAHRSEAEGGRLSINSIVTEQM